jgi:outer membrane lipoprotein SlyB
MAALVWVMIGLALWHFTVYLPDHFLGGIAGAFVGATLGALIGGLLLHGFSVPGREAVDLTTALEAVPGTLIGVGIMYALGLRQERAETAAAAA